MEGESGLRILIAEMPRLLRDLADRSMRGHPAVSLVRTLDDDADLENAVAALDPQVLVVCNQGGALPAGSSGLLDARAGLVVLALDLPSGEATLHRLRPERIALGPIALDQLVDAAAARLEAERRGSVCGSGSGSLRGEDPTPG